MHSTDSPHVYWLDRYASSWLAIRLYWLPRPDRIPERRWQVMTSGLFFETISEFECQVIVDEAGWHPITSYYQDRKVTVNGREGGG